jgi:hypothetical protein
MQHSCFPKLFRFREVATQVSLVTVSCPSPRTVAPPPCLPLAIKDSLKEDARFSDGGFFDEGWIDWWAACENDAAGGLLSYARD